MNHIGKRWGGKSPRCAEVGKYREPPGNLIAVVTMLPRKSAKRYKGLKARTETDTGGRVEYTEALERFTVKELGKLTP